MGPIIYAFTNIMTHILVHSMYIPSGIHTFLEKASALKKSTKLNLKSKSFHYASFAWWWDFKFAKIFILQHTSNYKKHPQVDTNHLDGRFWGLCDATFSLVLPLTSLSRNKFPSLCSRHLKSPNQSRWVKLFSSVDFSAP